MRTIPLTTMTNPSQSATPTVMIMRPTTDNWQVIFIAVSVATATIVVIIVAMVTLYGILKISKCLPDDFLCIQ